MWQLLSQKGQTKPLPTCRWFCRACSSTLTAALLSDGAESPAKGNAYTLGILVIKEWGRVAIPLSERCRGGFISLPFLNQGQTYLHLKITFSKNMIIPSRGQYVLKYSSIYLIIQLHPHILVIPPCNFRLRRQAELECSIFRCWVQFLPAHLLKI